jgi:hypothetical protein
MPIIVALKKTYLTVLVFPGTRAVEETAIG